MSTFFRSHKKKSNSSVLNARLNNLSSLTVKLLNSVGKDGTSGREDPPLHQGEAGGTPGQGGVQLLGGQVHCYLYRSHHPGAALQNPIIREFAVN